MGLILRALVREYTPSVGMVPPDLFRHNFVQCIHILALYTLLVGDARRRNLVDRDKDDAYLVAVRWKSGFGSCRNSS